MKKNNLVSIFSFVLALISFLILLFWSDIDTIILASSIGMVLSSVAIVLGFFGRKKVKTNNENGKGLALAGIIIGFVDLLFCGLSLLGCLAMQDINYADQFICNMDNYVSNCVDNGDGTSTCKYYDILDISCSTDKLKDSQFKK